MRAVSVAIAASSIVLLFCCLQANGLTEVERFEEAIAQLRTINTDLKKEVYNDFWKFLRQQRNPVSDEFWKKQIPRFKEMKKGFNGEQKTVFTDHIKVETNTTSDDTLSRINKLADDNTVEGLAIADQRMIEVKNEAQDVVDNLINLGKEVVDKIQKIEEVDSNVQNITTDATSTGAADAEVEKLKKTLYLITRQIQNMQFNEEEKTRSDGNSGIKQIRTRYVGGKSYFSASHTGKSFGAIHDHSNNQRICGMGEFIGVLNGVEFRTRHNDFSLRKPATGDKTYGKVEDLEFPAVPPAVKNKTTVEEEVEEMMKWFKAFKDQDHSTRDYRKYFKPILCYLEGAWTTKEGDAIDEPFASDRHHIDAKGWFDLQEKIRFTSYSGTKDLLENLAWLPTSIMGFDENDKPSFAQWNYRILCHPLKDDLPTQHLKPILDPHAQKMNSWDDETFKTKRAIRFDLEGIDLYGKRKDSPMSYTLLDSLMEQIPGKDNYGANIDATGFDADVLSANPKKAGEKLNGAYYHRPYKLAAPDAMGVDTTQRGYSDRLYVAMTTQDKIAGPSYKDKDGNIIKSKVSYAIPMEIIYLTPLAEWNPYNIEYVDKDPITGGGSKNNPYSKSNRKTFFQTPVSFFTGTAEVDDADTSQTDGVYIKNADGVKVKTQASGVRIMFPEIAGIAGQIRQRYPIMPIYGEGNTLWKRLNAFEDSLQGYQTHVDKGGYYYAIGESHSDQVTTHNHMVQISINDYVMLKDDKTKSLIVTSTKAIGHTHKFKVSVNDNNQLIAEECDDKPPQDYEGVDKVCFDRHPVTFTRSS